MMIDAKDFIPEGRRNHWLHPDLGLCVLREGMQPQEFIESLAMRPPVTPPDPDPRDVKIASIEARLEALETKVDTAIVEKEVTDGPL